METSFTCQRLQHVSVARPRGTASAADARAFYGGILGLTEIEPPRSLSAMDLVWYRLGDDELHIFAADDAAPDVGQHLCIQVDDLDALRAHLTDRGVPVVDDVAIPNRPRFFCRDPFGNRIECTAILGPYDA